jgi:diamine N-acetyltransferase
MHLRLLAETDLETTRSWRNHPESRRWFSDSRFIEAQAQRQWFASRAGLIDDLIFVLNDDDNRINAQLSVYNIDRIQRVAEVGRFLVAPDRRRQGVFREGFRLLTEYCTDTLQLSKLYLTVKQDNVPALEAYRKLGFISTDVNEPFVRMEKTL